MKRAILPIMITLLLCVLFVGPAFAETERLISKGEWKGFLQDIIDYGDSQVPNHWKAQTTEGPRKGRFGTYNCRSDENIALHAFLYQEPRSRYYHDPELLKRILMHLDYFCLGQGINGGYDEIGDWVCNGDVGVMGPDYGDASRLEARNGIIGFTFYALGRGMTLLFEDHAETGNMDFINALSEMVDHDYDGATDESEGTPKVTRRKALMQLIDGSHLRDITYKGMDNVECKGGGLIDYLFFTTSAHGYDPHFSGGCANLTTGVINGIYFLNLSYDYLRSPETGGNGEPSFIDNGAEFVLAYRDWLFGRKNPSREFTVGGRKKVDDNRPIQFYGGNRATKEPCFSSKGMVKEGGPIGPDSKGNGYDGNYGVISMQLIATYAAHSNDPVAKDFVTKMMEGYQYFYVLDPTHPKGGYHHYQTVRRNPGHGGVPPLAYGLIRKYHEAANKLFLESVNSFIRSGKDMDLFFGEARSRQVECAWLVEFFENDPSYYEATDYVLPCNRKETFDYYDNGGSESAYLSVHKTGPEPTSVTWKAYEWNADKYPEGAVKNGSILEYTYQGRSSWMEKYLKE
jgi:hypothetical protein